MVVCVTPPPVPVMVIVDVPSVARLEAVNLMVELPLPPVIDVGLNETVVPLLCPLAESEIEVMVPDVTAVVIFAVPEELRDMVSVVGLAEMVKATGTAVTVSVRDVVSIVPSEPVPVMVMVCAPVATVDPTVKVSSEEPPGVMGLVP